MGKLTAKIIVDWLRENVGNTRNPDSDKLFIVHDWCGSTESGFWDEYELDYDKLETEMDEWIRSTFNS